MKTRLILSLWLVSIASSTQASSLCSQKEPLKANCVSRAYEIYKEFGKLIFDGQPIELCVYGDYVKIHPRNMSAPPLKIDGYFFQSQDSNQVRFDYNRDAYMMHIPHESKEIRVDLLAQEANSSEIGWQPSGVFNCRLNIKK